MTPVPTIRFDIFIAGDLAQAKQVCREYCFNVGLCVTIEPVEFIYTGGEESGVRVGLIHYPRFPTTEEALYEHAIEIATFLMRRLCQHSYSIVGPRETVWFSRRPSEPALSDTSQDRAAETFEHVGCSTQREGS